MRGLHERIAHMALMKLKLRNRSDSGECALHSCTADELMDESLTKQIKKKVIEVKRGKNRADRHDSAWKR